MFFFATYVRIQHNRLFLNIIYLAGKLGMRNIGSISNFMHRNFTVYDMTIGKELGLDCPKSMPVRLVGYSNLTE